MSAREFVFPDPGVPRIPIERLDINSERAARAIAESRPFVARVDWPCTRWTPSYLRDKIGQLTVDVHRRDATKESLTISRFLDLIDGQRTPQHEYVLHNFPVMRLKSYDGVTPGMEELFAEVTLPAYLDRARVKEIYVWARNTGFHDNKSHAEPNAAANLNLQVRGKKHLWLFPPVDAGKLGAASPREEMMGPPFFSAGQTAYSPADRPDFRDVHCYEAVLEEGDVVHIPTFWYHWFVHYDAYQLNMNVWFTPPQVPLSPTAAEWAYMNALCLALGGYHVAPAAFAALPVEVQELLCQVARTLVEDPRCSDTNALEQLKRDAPRLGYAVTKPA